MFAELITLNVNFFFVLASVQGLLKVCPFLIKKEMIYVSINRVLTGGGLSVLLFELYAELTGIRGSLVLVGIHSDHMFRIT